MQFNPAFNGLLWLRYVVGPLFFLAPASIYWHCRAVIKRQDNLSHRDFLWIIPSIIIIPFWIIWFFLDAQSQNLILRNDVSALQGVPELLFIVIMIYRLLFYVIYIIAYILILKLVRNQIKNLGNVFSNTESIKFYSLLGLLWPLGLILVASIIAVLVILIPGNFTDALGASLLYQNAYYWIITLSRVALVTNIFVAAVKVLNHSESDDEAALDLANTKQNIDSDKYKNSALDAESIDRLGKKIDHLMESKRLYLSGMLTLAVLSRESGIDPHYISQALNQGRGVNFFDYVNQLRIKEATRLFESPDSADQTIIEIAYASGFNSKSTFNTAFKKLMNETPSAYRARLNSSN